MSVIIKSGASATLASVDTNNNLQVNMPVTIAQAGSACAASEEHDGLTGVARLVRSTDTGIDFRFRVGTDVPLFQDNFTHSTINLSAYQNVSATMTHAMSGGYLVLNSGNSVASGAVARTQTYKAFPVYGTYPMYFEAWARFVLTPQTNNVAELGFGYASGTSTPTDGVYFKMDTAGVIRGVVNFNGTEVTTGALTTASANTVFHYLIVLTTDRAEFWINGSLQGALDRSTTAPSLSLSQSMPVLLRLYNSAATSGAQRLEVAALNISQGDMAPIRTLNQTQSGMAQHAIVVPPGAAAGQTANFANSAAPASATLSNTAAGYTTLGGQFQFAAVAGAETDYALFGYQVQQGTAALPGKTLYINDISINTYNTVVAVGATATVMQWGVGVGSTAVSLATADSVTAGTRAPRKMVIGVQSFAGLAAIGAAATPLVYHFDAPLVVEPGTFFHVILKMPIGLATATEIFRGTVTVSGYFE